MTIVHATHFEQGKKAWSEVLDPARWKGATPDEIVREVVSILVTKRRQHRGLLRALSLYARSKPEAGFAAHASEMNLHVYRLFRTLLLPRLKVIHPNPGRAVDFAFFLIDAVTREAILFADTGLTPERFSNRVLIAELHRACLAYLETGPELRRKK